MVASNNARPPFDAVIQSITDYVFDYQITSEKAWRRARIALLDSLGCATESVPACNSFIGPMVKGTVVPNGFPLPGTSHVLDPLTAAFNLGALIRYLDHNDAFPGAGWGHPSVNIGAILPVAYWLSASGNDTVTMRDVFEAIIKAYEIQGCFQIKTAFNKVGIGHVVLVKFSCAAVVSKPMGLNREQTNDAVSQVFSDGQPLRVYRQSPNTRKWFALPRPFATTVIEHCFIKLVVAEGHGISAVEAALTLSAQLRGRLVEVRSIRIRTHAAAMTIIDKTGPLHNAADRDHCMRYMVAVTLLKGAWLDARDYEDDSAWARDPRVDVLRAKITMEEDPQMTRDYHERMASKAASSLLVTVENGTVLDEVLVERPIGHPWHSDTIDKAKEKFVKLTDDVLRDPAGLWEETMAAEGANVKVRDWMDQFVARQKTILNK